VTRRLRIAVEVIVVEWCPLPDAPPLAGLLHGCAARVVTVPSDVARDRFADADEIPLWIFSAKNVGIRRARAPFVLATNPDVLYTPALLRSQFESGCFYRTPRHDVRGVRTDLAPREQLRLAARSVAAVHLVGGSVTFDEPPGPLALRRAIGAYTVEQRRTAPATPVERAERPTDWLHTNASGDFFLLHREHWSELRGYPERPSAGHLDSYMCAMAASAGLEQRILGGRRRLYHLDHARAIDWERQEEATHYYVPYETFLADAREMLLGRAPYVANGERWGFGDVELPEARVSRSV
jgi:hypothetical protein